MPHHNPGLVLGLGLVVFGLSLVGLGVHWPRGSRPQRWPHRVVVSLTSLSTRCLIMMNDIFVVK